MNFTLKKLIERSASAFAQAEGRSGKAWTDGLEPDGGLNLNAPS